MVSYLLNQFLLHLFFDKLIFFNTKVTPKEFVEIHLLSQSQFDASWWGIMRERCMTELCVQIG